MDVIATVALSDSEKRDLSQILGCSQANLADALAVHASAALSEYITMFLGQRVFRRGTDLQEYRLLLLIEKAFGGNIPAEEDVCRLFQTTSSESRALIRRVMSKYQYQLKATIERSMKRILSGASQSEEGGLFIVTVNSLNLVDELNRLLAEIDGTLQPVSKKRGSVSTYEISPASHERLSTKLGN
jgi:predicted transcriptional regulator